MSALDPIFAELDQKPTLSGYAAAERKLKDSGARLSDFRLAILTNHTLDIGTVLTVECARRGMRAVLYNAGYDQYRQELLDPASGMAKFQPDAVFISLHLENIELGVSSASCGFTDGLPEPRAWVEQFQALLAKFREGSAVPVLLQNFIPPASDMDGILSIAGRKSVFDYVMELNSELRRMASAMPNVFVIDAARLACRNDLAGWSDRRMWFLARAGINPKKFPLLGAEIARYCAALRSPAAKCLVVDLDNTVWGGILGDVGSDGIQCTSENYPGSAYSAFQRALLALRSRGILLAVASKNTASVVEEAFRTRHDMVLRPEHITDWEVHWEPKSDSLKRIAERLNIGVDSLVFLDDNPAEVAQVKMMLPGVRAYQMPSRPEDFVEFLSKLTDFDQLHLSAEDMRRPELYELRKKQVPQAGTDLESFYRSLKTVLAPERSNDANFDRIVQLIHKTNQFNLTTRRHDAAELRRRDEQGSELWAFRARDVHGDHGIIAVALLDFHARECTIDTLLMSCRVFGRTLESAILHFLEERAVARYAKTMAGEYLPTPKNEPCKHFLERHSYIRVEQNESGSRWSKNLEEPVTKCPEWIEIEGEPVCNQA